MESVLFFTFMWPSRVKLRSSGLCGKYLIINPSLQPFKCFYCNCVGMCMMFVCGHMGHGECVYVHDDCVWVHVS